MDTNSHFGRVKYAATQIFKTKMNNSFLTVVPCSTSFDLSIKKIQLSTILITQKIFFFSDFSLLNNIFNKMKT